jgi:hypothetical protein
MFMLRRHIQTEVITCSREDGEGCGAPRVRDELLQLSGLTRKEFVVFVAFCR